MFARKKLVIIISLALVLVLLGLSVFVTESFLLEVILHIYLRLLWIPLVLVLFQKGFEKQITHSMKLAKLLCGITIAVDLVIIDAVRYILNRGISTVLFLPVCLPICFMLVMHFSHKDTAIEEESSKAVYLIGIPLLLFAIYSEVSSFIQ